MTEITVGCERHAAPSSEATGDSRPDAELLSRFVRYRDEAAFERLVRRHGSMVMGVCRRVLNHPQDAEDAFQATFLVLTRKSSAIRRPEMLGNWLYGVAYRCALKIQSTKPKATAMSETQPPLARPGPDVAQREIQAVIDEELQHLPDRDRQVLTLCYFQGLTHKEVADRLGWRPGSVSRRVARSQALLRSRLTRRGITLSVGPLSLLLTQMGTSPAVAADLIASTVNASVALAAGGRLESVASPRVAAVTRAIRSVPLPILAALVTGLLLLGSCNWIVSSDPPFATEPAAKPPTAAGLHAVPHAGREISQWDTPTARPSSAAPCSGSP